MSILRLADGDQFRGTLHDRGGLVYNALAYDVPNDGTDATTALDALLSSVNAAGGGTVCLPDGTYAVTGLTAHSNLTIRLSDGATLKLAVGATAPILTGSAVSNFKLLGGKLDGNRASQSGTPGSDSLLRGVYLLDGCSHIEIDTYFQNFQGIGCYVENPGDDWTFAGGGENCTAGNSGVFYILHYNETTARGFVYRDLRIDNSASGSGGFKVACVNTGSELIDHQFVGAQRIKIGEFGSGDITEATLGMELFGNAGGLIRHARGGDFYFEGPNDTSTQTWGFSCGGETDADGIGGVQDVTLSRIETYRCRRQGVELVGVNINIGQIILRESAGCPAYASAILGGAYGINIDSIVSIDHVGGEPITGSTNPLGGSFRGVNIGKIVAIRSGAPLFGIGQGVTFEDFTIGRLIALDHNSWGVAATGSGAMRRGFISSVNIQYTASPSSAFFDGIVLGPEGGLEQVHVRDVIVDGAPRCGVLYTVAPVDCSLNNVQAEDAGNVPVLLSGGGTLPGDWNERDGFAAATNGDTSPSVFNVKRMAFGYSTTATVKTLDDGYEGQELFLIFTTGNQTFDFTAGDAFFRGRITNFTPPAGSWAVVRFDGTYWQWQSHDTAVLGDFNTFRRTIGVSVPTSGFPVLQTRVDGETDPRVQTTAAGDAAYSTGSGSADAVTGRNGAGQFGMIQGSLSAGSLWNDGHFVMGPYHWWIHAGSYPRFKFGTPASDADGVRIPFQAAALAVALPADGAFAALTSSATTTQAQYNALRDLCEEMRDHIADLEAKLSAAGTLQ